MDSKVRIIIADDHPIFLLGMKTMMAGIEGIEVVGTARDGREAIDVCRRLKPDVALLDVMMPEVDGIEAAAVIRAESSDVKVLMLSADTTSATVDTLIEMGVDGFITKNTSPQEIANAVVSVAQGYNYYGTDVARIIECLHSAKNVVNSIFTPREMDVIELSCQGLQYKEIADRLNIKTKTVDNIKANIFHKLGINNTVELVRYAIKNGIISL